jgi:hypothetical protein
VSRGFKHKPVIVKLEPFEGDDTAVRLEGTRDGFLYCVVRPEEDGPAEIVDTGYRSYAEAKAAWPEAL